MKQSYPIEKLFRKFTAPAKYFVLHVVLERPGIYLREIRRKLLLKLGVDVVESTICTFLEKSSFTKQRFKLYAIQRDELLHNQFAIDVSLYSKEMLVFLDETGTD